MRELIIGKNNDGIVNLSLSTLSTHCAILGSSGCGKTVALKVLIEELCINNVPTIAIDPHGDISSLVYLEENIDLLKDKGISETHIKSFKENAEVMIWTPGSEKGLPLCINPLQFNDMPQNLEDRIQYLSYSAQTLVSALNYEDKKQSSIYSALQIIFQYYTSENIDISNFTKLIYQLESIPEKLSKEIKMVGLSLKGLDELKHQLYKFTVGAESLLFETGEPLDIDLLLGKGSDKTRISIIYLNSISTDIKKEFFISVLNQKIFYWMKKKQENTYNNKLKCAYLIDEISPWIPPVRKPLCKESFERLFKEARKFGVSLIVATQSPGDIDYKIISQVSTTLLGKIQTKQEIEKVKNKIESKNNLDLKKIISTLPDIQTGTFLIISKEYSDIIKVNIRWLLTKHGIDNEGKSWLIASNDLKSIMKEEKKQFFSNQNNKNKEQVSAPIHMDDIDIKETNNHNYDDDTVWTIKNKIFERDVSKKIRQYLKGNLIFKSEKLIKAKFKYLSLIRVECTFIKEKGFFKKSEEKIDDIKLYLNRYDNNNDIEYKILSFYNNIQFDSIINKDPHKIKDLDDMCELVQKKRSELRDEFEFRGRKEIKKIEKDIVKLMEKKYNVNVNAVYLTLLPIWECKISNKEDESCERRIDIDAIYGKKIKY